MIYVELAAFNLNQLVALDALLHEGHVGRAASRVGVTQSAMSHTLRALRDALEDPLLVRVGNDMVPTPYAEQVAERLEAGLGALQSVISGRAAFDPSTITDTFTLTTLDGLAAGVASSLLSELSCRAPRAGLRFLTVDTANVAQQLERGGADLAILPPFMDLSGLETRAVPSPTPDVEQFCLLCADDHPEVGDKVSLARYCKLRHAAVSIEGSGPSFIDHLLAERGRSREVAVRVPYVLALAEMVASSDLVATTVVAMADFLCERWPLKKVPLPFKVPAGPVLMVWHPRYSAEPSHRFFREVLEAAMTRPYQAARRRRRRNQ